jgi:hypothetical protein
MKNDLAEKAYSAIAHQETQDDFVKAMLEFFKAFEPADVKWQATQAYKKALSDKKAED